MDARSSVGHGSAVGSAWRVGSEVDSGWAAGSSRSGSVAGAGEWGWEGGPTTAPSWTARPALRSSSSSHYPAPPPPPAPTITTPPTSPPLIGLRPPTIIPTSRPATVAPTKRSPSPVSQAMQRAMMSTPDPPRPQPTHDARIQESGGLALKPAQRAMFGRHRHAMERFIWTLDTEHDERVQGLIDWIGVMGWALSSLALSKFLAWRQRGALFANADFRPWKHPEEPAFDWMTFDEVQNTLDKTLQESIATYDPHTTALVFVFLVSKTGSSVGIWRRKVSVPPSLQLKHANEVESVKKELERKGGVVVKVERPLTQKPPPIPMATPPPEASPPYMPIALPPPPPPTTAIVVSSPEVKVVKKRRWWQFWKKRERGKEKVDVMRERGKLSKRR
ncbi:hypothetical protein FRB99_001504 [Tulasnella sp. 403]|nr:hypothetical protein FRB99_001504 [Tulasnella sp. 403]